MPPVLACSHAGLLLFFLVCFCFLFFGFFVKERERVRDHDPSARGAACRLSPIGGAGAARESRRPGAATSQRV